MHASNAWQSAFPEHACCAAVSHCDAPCRTFVARVARLRIGAAVLGAVRRRARGRAHAGAAARAVVPRVLADLSARMQVEAAVEAVGAARLRRALARGAGVAARRAAARRRRRRAPAARRSPARQSAARRRRAPAARGGLAAGRAPTRRAARFFGAASAEGRGGVRRAAPDGEREGEREGGGDNRGLHHARVELHDAIHRKNGRFVRPRCSFCAPSARGEDHMWIDVPTEAHRGAARMAVSLRFSRVTRDGSRHLEEQRVRLFEVPDDVVGERRADVAVDDPVIEREAESSITSPMTICPSLTTGAPSSGARRGCRPPGN